MKVGGNESATKYFQSHGGSAALASKDTKVKYTCNAAVKYKEELKRRAALDAQQSVDPISVELAGLRANQCYCFIQVPRGSHHYRYPRWHSLGWLEHPCWRR